MCGCNSVVRVLVAASLYLGMQTICFNCLSLSIRPSANYVPSLGSGVFTWKLKRQHVLTFLG